MTPDTDVIELATRRAPEWFPGFEVVRVEQRQVLRKQHSTVHELAVVGPEETQRCFVKEPKSRDGGDHPNRPRAVSEQPVGHKAELQAAALDDLHRAVRGAGDALLGSVRVLDRVDDRLVVLSAADGAPLRDRVMAHVRWRHRDRIDLVGVFARTGTILRLFHEDVRRPHVAEALADRGEVSTAASEFLTYLARSAGTTTTAPIERRLLTEIDRHLPERATTSTHFGDFGLTNLLVTEEGAVTAIDTLAALRTPPLHDAAYLVSGLLAIRPQVMTLGHAISPRSMDDWTAAFWAGYLGDRQAPDGAIAVWTAIRLLERWVAKTSRTSSALARRGPGAIVDRYLAQLVDDVVTRAEWAEARPDDVNDLTANA